MKLFRRYICILLASILLTGCSQMENVRNTLIEINVEYPQGNVGEIYGNPIDVAHIAGSDTEVQYIDNEVLVVAEWGAKKFEVEQLANKYNAEIVGYIEQTGDYQFKLNDVYSKDELQQFVSSLESEDIIESACLNFVMEVSDDTINYGSKWKKDLKNYEDCKGKSWGVEAIRAPQAWELLEENEDRVNKNLRVGLIDSGFDLEHDDLGFAEKFENYNSGISESDQNHGTHVAGTMAAISDNNEGICGVYPYGNGNLYGVSITGITAYSENGNPFLSTMYNKIALAELILRDVKIINSSLNNNRERVVQISEKKEHWEDALENLNENADILGDFLNRLLIHGYDFVIVSASGNSSNESTGNLEASYNSFLNSVNKDKYPNVYNRIIVVGAVDKNTQICSFSNAGSRTDIYAPGEAIYSTKPDNKYGSDFDDYDENGKLQTYLYSGTSMAAPHVAGIAAMVWAVDSKLTGEMVKMIVCHSASTKSTELNIADVKIAVMAALKINGKYDDVFSDSVQPNNGGVMAYVVDKADESKFIAGATVTAENTENEKMYTAITDSTGHFELLLPDGLYEITIFADGYENFVYPEPVKVTSKGVNYIDWAKLTKGNTNPVTEITERYPYDFYGWSINDIEAIYGEENCEEVTENINAAYGLYVETTKYLFLADERDEPVYSVVIKDGGQVMPGVYIGDTVSESIIKSNGAFDADKIAVSDVDGKYIFFNKTDNTEMYIEMDQESQHDFDNVQNYLDSMRSTRGLVKFVSNEGLTNSIEDRFKKAIYEAYPGNDIFYFKYDIYDGEKYSAFAVTGDDPDGYCDVLFLTVIGNDIKLTVLKEHIGTYTYGNQTEVIKKDDIILFHVTEGYGGSGSSSHVWLLTDEGCRECKFIAEGFMYGGENDFYIHPSDFDASTSPDGQEGVGHTWKRYYLFWNGEDFSEYGGIYISEQQLIDVGGGEYISSLKKQGYIVRNIIYRSNGIININYYKIDDVGHHENAFLTLKLEDNKIIDVGYNYSGIYKTSYFYENVVYPDSWIIDSTNNNIIKGNEYSKEQLDAYAEDIANAVNKYMEEQTTNDRSTYFLGAVSYSELVNKYNLTAQYFNTEYMKRNYKSGELSVEIELTCLTNDKKLPVYVSKVKMVLDDVDVYGEYIT